MPDLAGRLIEKFFSTSGGELYVGGVAVGSVVAEYGTPLFIYDSRVFDLKWDLLRRTLPAEFAISYSVKANPNPVILRHFMMKGCGLEIASAGECQLALKAGCSADGILFAGPGKTEADLEFVLARDIGEIHLESQLELQRISAIARKLGRRARVAVRVNPSAEAQGGAMRMGGKPAPFGIDEENLGDVVREILRDAALEFRGVHLFTGTQILDHEVLIRQYRKGMEIGLSVARSIERPLHTIDFGGGLGIPYFAGDQELNMQLLAGELYALMREARKEPLFSGTQFVLEPGRYLVGEAGVYVTRVTDIKVSRGKKFLVLDGGMNHHLAASGNLGQVIKKNFPVVILNKTADTARERVDVVGPLCTPLDVLARDIDLPPAEVEDLVGIPQSGAYARAASPLGFLSHLTPPEILVEDGKARLIRRRGTYQDLLADLSFDIP
jgi:diaminopimelate decarboxylase